MTNQPNALTDEEMARCEETLYSRMKSLDPGEFQFVKYIGRCHITIRQLKKQVEELKDTGGGRTDCGGCGGSGCGRCIPDEFEQI